MFVTVLLISVLLYAIYAYFTWHNDRWKKLGVPYVPPTFFLGNTPNVLLQKRNSYYDIQDIYKKFRGTYRIAGFFNLRTPQLLVLDPTLVREIFVKNFRNFTDNGFGAINKEVDTFLGHNPFFLSGSEWKDKRTELTPAFTVSRIRAMYPLIEDVCHNLGDYIDRETKLSGTGGINARELSARFTTDVVSNCIFALDAGALKDRESAIRKMGTQIFSPGLRLVVLFVLNEICPKAIQILRLPFVPKHVEAFFTGLMRDAIDYRKKNNVDKSDYLQYLLGLREKKNWSDTEVVANAMTFFIDGFETSSLTMSHILYELGSNKRVQEKLRKEINDAGALTMESIADLKYLDQVIHESLRLNPAAMFSVKRCTEEFNVSLTNDGKESIKIAPDTQVVIPVYDIHRDPENYENPLDFYPERFDDENGGIKAYRDKGMLLAFGDGPRICLGMRFALTQVKAAIVEMVKKYDVSVNGKMQLPLVLDPKEFLTFPQGGIWVDFKKL